MPIIKETASSGKAAELTDRGNNAKDCDKLALSRIITTQQANLEKPFSFSPDKQCSESSQQPAFRVLQLTELGLLSKQTRIQKAAAENKVDELAILLASRVDAHKTAKHRRTAQHTTSELLPQAGVVVNAANGRACTSLQSHAKNKKDRTPTGQDTQDPPIIALLKQGGGITELRSLLENGANIHAVDSLKLTALHLAVFENNLEVVKFLLEAGIDPNAKDIYGDDALYNAIRRGNQEMVKLLLEAGIDPNSKNRTGETACHHAAIFNRHDIAKLLLESKGTDINVQDVCGRTPLRTAVRHLSPEIIDLLIMHGADVNIKDIDEISALAFAAQHSYKITAVLLRAGADINTTDSRGTTALHEAIDNSQCDIVRLLLAAGADANMKGPQGTPLNNLLYIPKEQALLIKNDLLKTGITVNAAKNRINTPEEQQLLRELLEDEDTIKKETSQLKETVISSVREQMMRSRPNSNLFAKGHVSSLGLPDSLVRGLLWNHELADELLREEGKDNRSKQ